MDKYIICGEINKYHGLIILPIIFLLLQDLVFGVSYNNSFRKTKLLGLKRQYYTIHILFCYIVIFVSSFIFYKCKIKKTENLLTKKIKTTKEQNNSKKKFLTFLLIIILWVLEEQLKDIYSNTLNNLDFWMLELIIISYFNKKTFNAELYKHHLLSFLIIIFPFIFKIITIVLSFNSENQNSPIYYNSIYIIPLGIAFYIILLISDAYFLTKIKWFMDIKYISITEILMYFGLFGTIFYLILSLILLFKKCPKFLANNYCFKGNNTETFYNFENFYFYIKEMMDNKKLIFEEIIVCLIGSFSFLFEYVFNLLIIKHLSPIHKIISTPLFFFFEKFLLGLNIVFRKDLFSEYDSNYYLCWKFILDTTGDIFSIFALIIYLEIIELSFCDFNHNTRRTISFRADKDKIIEDKDKAFIILADGEVDEISLPNNSIEMSKKNL